LPGGSADGVFMDYIAYDAKTIGCGCLPGNSAAVDVFDAATHKLTQITGFATQEMERHGHKRVSARARVGGARRRVRRQPRRLDSVRVRRDHAGQGRMRHARLDARRRGLRGRYLGGVGDHAARSIDPHPRRDHAGAEGAPAVRWRARGLRGRRQARPLSTPNLEDKDQTLAIDLKTHATVATWPTTCGEEGGHGISLDPDAGFLFVACSTRSEVMDVATTARSCRASIPATASTISTTWPRPTLYVASSRQLALTVAKVGPAGELTSIAVVPTVMGARNGVADARARSTSRPARRRRC